MAKSQDNSNSIKHVLVCEFRGCEPAACDNRKFDFVRRVTLASPDDAMREAIKQADFVVGKLGKINTWLADFYVATSSEINGVKAVTTGLKSCFGLVDKSAKGAKADIVQTYSGTTMPISQNLLVYTAVANKKTGKVTVHLNP